MIINAGMPQQYCLRWNNHRANLLTVFDELLRNEAFTDVTLVCEGGLSVKCHKMVLAACSSYFQCLFSDLPCRHPVVVLKDVRYVEIKAILEYMYRGEVSIAQDQLAALLKVAEALKVKGLVEENSYKAASKEEDMNTIISTSAENDPMNINNNNNNNGGNNHSHGGSSHHYSSGANGAVGKDGNNSIANDSGDLRNSSSSSNSNAENCSPPHSTGIHQPFQKSSYPYGKSQPMDRSSAIGNRLPLPVWPMPGLSMSTPPPQTTAAMFNSCYEAVIAAGNADMPPLRRKKLSSLLMSRDTPILRTVLGGQGQGQGPNQGQADSSQPVSLVCHSDNQDQMPQSNGPTTPQDGSFLKGSKSESMSEDTHSPYMESPFMEEDMNQERMKMMHPSSTSPQSFLSEPRGGVSGIATYVPTQKPEWKRYKQYTRNDIMSAIDAVRNGMSALQASRKYGVPSRTLYDKVKKLGITTSRPFRRSNSSNGAAFPYSLSGGPGGMVFGMSDDDSAGPTGGMLEHGFLQHALEIGGKIKMDPGEREAMSSTPSSMPAHGFLQHALEVGERIKAEREALSNMGPGAGPISRASSSPGPNDRSPSRSPPNLIKYAPQRSRSLSASPPPPMDEEEEDDYEDQVEDLSMTRKPEQQPTRVIMPPMSQAAAAAMMATCAASDNARD